MDGQSMRLSAALEGRYRIDRELGQGGMATVYLAHDLKHDRKVALKVLRPELSAILGGERFLAEIKTTANLQHPHILGLFDSGEAEGVVFYVMPFVEGESLRDRLAREKQLPVEEAVRLAREVADALNYAHERGVIHRDIKPENILLHGGHAMVADFGIALAVSATDGAGRMTEAGMSLGTPHYMSPEQAMGERQITPRADIYAVGCVLYEMLTAEPPFVGATMQAIVARVMVEEPRSLTAQRRAIPPNVEAAVRVALEKLPADRFATAKAFADALANPAFRHDVQVSDSGAATGARAPVWRPLALGLAALSTVLLAAMLLRGTGGAADAIPTTLDLDVSDLEDLTSFAVSRDGRMIAVSAQSAGVRQIWIRNLGEAEFRPLPGTEAGTNPEFSPDGRWVAFYNPPRNALLKIALAGGGALPVVEVDTLRPARPSWGTDETIVFANPRGVWRVASSGQAAPVVMNLSVRGLFFARAQLLPDGSGVLADDPRGIHFIDIATDSVRLLVAEAQWPTYLETGHLLYESRSGGLFVVPLDLRRHEVTGPPVPVLDGVASRSFAVSTNGTLIYRSGAAPAASQLSRLVFLDRAGRPDTVRLSPREVFHPRISPDGRAVAFMSPPGRLDRTFPVQIHDFQDGSTKTIVTEGLNDFAVWSPDGRQIAFASNQQQSEDVDMFVVPADGSAAPQRVASGPGPQIPEEWVANDLIVFRDDSPRNPNIRLLRLGPGGAATAYVEGDNPESHLSVSRDGAFAAYMEVAGTLGEVYVREFPVPRGKWRVGAGCCPRWSPSGRELYMWGPDSAGSSLLEFPVERTPRFVAGPPRRLFSGQYNPLVLGWDVHPDGRFLVSQLPSAAPARETTGQAPRSRYVVVLNWFEELKAKLSATEDGRR